MEQRGVWVIRVCHCSDVPEHGFLLHEEQDPDFPFVSSPSAAEKVVVAEKNGSKSIPDMNLDSGMWVKSQTYIFCRESMRTWVSDAYVSDGLIVIIPQCTLKGKLAFLWIPMKSNISLKDLDLKTEVKEEGWRMSFQTATSGSCRLQCLWMEVDCISAQNNSQSL